MQDPPLHWLSAWEKRTKQVEVPNVIGQDEAAAKEITE